LITHLSPNIWNFSTCWYRVVGKVPSFVNSWTRCWWTFAHSVLVKHYLRADNSSVSRVTKKWDGQLRIHSSIPSRSRRDFSLHHSIQKGARIAVTKLQTAQSMVQFPAGTRGLSLLQNIQCIHYSWHMLAFKRGCRYKTESDSRHWKIITVHDNSHAICMK
jgi:hypothetical protein